MNKDQLRYLVERVLRYIGLWSKDAENLILGTIAQESRMGKYIRQLGKGPALGICQMERETFYDIRDNFLCYRQNLKNLIKDISNVNTLAAESLEYNLALSIAMCRVHYLRVPKPIPHTLEGYAKYWKEYYNTPLGKGTEDEFIENYLLYVGYED